MKIKMILDIDQIPYSRINFILKNNLIDYLLYIILAHQPLFLITKILELSTEIYSENNQLIFINNVFYLFNILVEKIFSN